MWALLFAAVIFIQQLSGPVAGDSVEYGFVFPSGAYGDTVRRIGSLADLVESQGNFYMRENGRVVVHSLVQPLCAMRLPWLFALLDAAVFLLFVWLILRLLRWSGGWRQVLLASAGAYSYIAPCSTDLAFQVNYLWVGTLVVLYLLVWFRGRATRWWEWVAVAALGFATGESNEAFTAGMALSMVFWFMRRRTRTTTVRVVLALCFGAGLFVNVLAPGNQVRLSAFMPDPPLWRLLHLMVNSWYILLLAVVLILRRRDGFNVRQFFFRHRFETLAFIAQGTVLLAVGAVYLYACMGMRLLLLLLLLGSTEGWRIGRGWLLAIAALCVARGAAAIADAAGKGVKYRYIREAYMQSADGAVELPSRLLNDDYRITQAMSKPFGLERRLFDADAPVIKVMPEGLDKIPADADTNMMWQTDALTWVIVQSRRHPKDYWLEKRLVAGGGLVNVRRINLDPGFRLDYWTEADAWRAGVYHNCYPWLFTARITDYNPTN